MTLRVIANLPAKPDKVDEVKALLLSLVAPTRAEAGCIKYDLLQSTSDPAQFTFDEEWTSDAALDAHLATPHVSGALGKMPLLLAGDPDIRRYHQIG